MTPGRYCCRNKRNSRPSYREVKDELPASLYNQITDIVVLGGAADRVAPMIQDRFSLPVEKARVSLFENARGNALQARAKVGGRAETGDLT